MKIYEGLNDKGQLAYFEVSNGFLTRKSAVGIIREIPGAQIIKVEIGKDTFCIFKLGGRVFELMEPFGDSSRFHIGEPSVRYSPELLLLKDKFSAH